MTWGLHVLLSNLQNMSQGYRQIVSKHATANITLIVQKQAKWKLLPFNKKFCVSLEVLSLRTCYKSEYVNQ